MALYRLADAALGGVSMQVVQAVLRRLLDKGVGQSGSMSRKQALIAERSGGCCRQR